MAVEATIAAYRTRAFKDILSQAFKSFPVRVDEILEDHHWDTFQDFMAGVARAGQIYLQEKTPSELIVKNQGADAAVKKMLAEANTEAMFKLLAVAFYGEPEEEAAREALEPLEIASWYQMSMTTLTAAMEAYHQATGLDPLASMKAPTRALFGMKPDSPPEEVRKIVDAFGLTTPDHLVALMNGFFTGEISFEDLDGAVDDYARVTELVNRSPSNTKKGVVFGKFDDGGTMGAACLGVARPTYTEELLAYGVQPIRSNEEAREAFGRWGLPNTIVRQGAAIETLFAGPHPDLAVVYVDDDQDGKIMAVDVRRGGPSTGLSGPLEKEDPLVMLRDQDWPVGKPGGLVAAKTGDWGAGASVIQGWRGPDYDAETFRRERLVEVNCGTVFQDFAGYWNCIPRGMKIY